MRRYALSVCCLLLLLCCASLVAGDEIDDHLQAIAKVGPQAENLAAAREAREALSSQGIAILPRILEALDTPNIVAANWYRTVYEEIVDGEMKKTKPAIPVDPLRRYVGDAKRQGRARRLVLALLDRLDPDYRDKFLATQLDDTEFRSDAVDQVLAAGDSAKKKDEKQAAIAAFKKAFKHARDSNQVTRAANQLQSLGEKVDIVQHMGFVTRWYLLGPFDAPETTGFARVFPPEKKVDLQAVYPGKEDKIGWKLYETDDRMGQLNLIKAIAPVREAVGYAYSEIDSPTEQDVQLRCGADDNLTVWLNGEKIFSQLQWLNGTRLDRFTAPAHLKKGKNVVLVKICQGPQHKNPAVPNNWSLQLRFCDASGAAVGLKTMLKAVKE